MRRSNELLEKRKQFVKEYANANQHKQMKVVTSELSEMLFVTERTIYTILRSINLFECDFKGKSNYKEGLQLVKEEKENSKYDAEYDSINNSNYELVHYSKRILIDGLENRIKARPLGFNKEKWIEYCNKSYLKRLTISATFLVSEINRIKYIS